MTSARLTPTTEHYTASAERAPVAGEGRRVEAAEGLGGDRRRSLREELNAAENDVGGQFREEAQRIAAQLAELSPAEQEKLTKSLSANEFHVVDEQV